MGDENGKTLASREGSVSLIIVHFPLAPGEDIVLIKGGLNRSPVWDTFHQNKEGA